MSLLDAEGKAGAGGGENPEEEEALPRRSFENLWTALGRGFAGMRERRHLGAPAAYEDRTQKSLGLPWALVPKKSSKGQQQQQILEAC